MAGAGRRRRGLVSAAVLALGLAGPAGAMTLQETVVRALHDNPTLQAAIQDRITADWQFDLAYAGYFPSVDLQVGQVREQVDDALTRAQDLQYNAFTHSQAGVSLTQMLFDSFRTPSAVARAGARVAASAHLVEASAEQLALLVAAAYLEVLRRQRNCDLAQDNLAAHTRIQDMIRQRVEGGVSRRSDLDQADSRLALAHSRVEEEQGALRDAGYEFARLVGEEPQDLALPQPPARPLPDTLPPAGDPALADLVAGHPSVRAAGDSVRAALAQLDLARADYGPRLALEVSETKDYDHRQDEMENTSVGLRLSVNLFAGGATRAGVGEAGAQVERTRAALAAAERDTEQGLRGADNALRTARERSVILRRYVSSIAAAQEAYIKQFGIGQRSLLDLVNSQDEQFAAQEELVAAEYTERLAVYRVFESLGVLLPALQVAPPAAATATTTAAATADRTP